MKVFGKYTIDNIKIPLYFWFFCIAMFFIVFALILIVAVKCQDVDGPDYFTAALYENRGKGVFENDTTLEYILKNLADYDKAASTAAQHNADIVIFSEYGIMPSIEKRGIMDYAPYVPDPKNEEWNPCMEPDRYNSSFILANLSCIAKENNIVILANIVSKTACNSTNCPEEGFYTYNTNVAFNRSGLLIARYRKAHLHGEEKYVNVLPEPEFVVFQTDFATIGTIICFDIVWKEAIQMVEKYKPDAVAFTSIWVEFYLPGMISVQVQQSWAITNNVTILAVNKQMPMYGAVGSGVFFGDTGIGNYMHVPDGQSRLLISKVPKKGVNPPQDFPPATIIEFGDNIPKEPGNNISSGVCSKKILGKPLNMQDFRCFDSNITGFTLVKIESEDHTEACQNGLCCQARYKVQLSDEDYYLAVINGTYTDFGGYKFWVEACLLMRCDPFENQPCSIFPTKSDTVFEELKIEANFTTSYVYPSISISGMQLPPKKNWVYNDDGLYFKTTTDKLLFASLFGRAYDRDRKE